MNIKTINPPLTREDVINLRAGDMVSITGNIITGRDRAHKYLLEQRPRKDDMPFDLSGAILYHCGPIIKKSDGGYKVISAGPTTSMRVEMYEASLIKKYKIKGIMGKGGMGKSTLKALEENSCIYLHTIGGAAAFLADRIKNTLGVWKLEEFGPTEAMWLFEVQEFPAIVTMDAYGNDLHREIENLSFKKFLELTGR